MSGSLLSFSGSTSLGSRLARQEILHFFGLGILTFEWTQNEHWNLPEISSVVPMKETRQDIDQMKTKEFILAPPLTVDSQTCQPFNLLNGCVQVQYSVDYAVDRVCLEPGKIY